MSNASGDTPGPSAPAEGQGRSPQDFTVPLPPSSATQEVPQRDPTRELPLFDPSPYAPPLEPYAAQPAADEQVDPLLEQIGLALFWITVGWWVFFLIRLFGYFVRFGGDATIVIRTIDRGAEETVIAAVLSLVAALLLLFGRGTRGRSPVGYAAAALALMTIVVALWRVLP